MVWATKFKILREGLPSSHSKYGPPETFLKSVGSVLFGGISKLRWAKSAENIYFVGGKRVRHTEAFVWAVGS